VSTKQIDNIIKEVKTPTTVGEAYSRWQTLADRLDTTMRSIGSGQKLPGNYPPITQGNLVEMSALLKGIQDTAGASRGVSMTKLFERRFALSEISRAMQLEMSKQPFDIPRPGMTSDWLRGVGGYSLIRGAMTGNLELAFTGIGELAISKGPKFFYTKARGGPGKVFESQLRKSKTIGPPDRVEAEEAPKSVFNELVKAYQARGMTRQQATQEALKVHRRFKQPKLKYNLSKSELPER
jgi:hypothetical protein